jgi:RimJ/RimL family protein N-acetyltransferase
VNVALRLIDELAARAIVAGDAPPGYRCPADYPAVGDRLAAGLFLQRLEAGLDPRPFGAFLVVLVSEAEQQTPLVIGGAGFHGGVDEGGRVEVGYGIVASRQGRGYATRALGLLVERAREFGAVTVIAEAEAENVASRRVLAHCGFSSVKADVERFELGLNR